MLCGKRQSRMAEGKAARGETEGGWCPVRGPTLHEPSNQRASEAEWPDAPWLTTSSFTHPDAVDPHRTYDSLSFPAISSRPSYSSRSVLPAPVLDYLSCHCSHSSHTRAHPPPLEAPSLLLPPPFWFLRQFSERALALAYLRRRHIHQSTT